ncbi:hypothetical protein BH23ACI1_BH23ACI1_11880 [soil metagenome]
MLLGRFLAGAGAPARQPIELLDQLPSAPGWPSRDRPDWPPGWSTSYNASAEPINPLIGAAGVSAVPMSARVVSRVGTEANPDNMLLMHAVGPNVAGVIGSAVAAGVVLTLLGVGNTGE